MDILFLGTGAADWAAEPPRPDYAPGEWRGFASALINDTILIDCGPTVPAALDRFDVDPAAIEHLLVTHGHGDHYHLDSIAAIAQASPLHVHADPTLLPELADVPGVTPHALALWEPLSLGSLTVTPVLGNHPLQRPDEQAYHFILADDATTLLYATDGSWLPNQTWQTLRRLHLDGIVWEATCGDTDGDWRIYEHSSIAMVELQRETLVRQGVLPVEAPIWLTHLARTLCSPHDQLAKAIAPKGLALAYDGLRASV
jgi:adenosylcobinamide kinase/adenosylcobinamide-phosphate guanylyltransferase